jgi:hypothetical protein
VTQLSPDDEFLVLATDGLWDYMTEEEVAAFIRQTVQTKPREEVTLIIIFFIITIVVVVVMPSALHTRVFSCVSSITMVCR